MTESWKQLTRDAPELAAAIGARFSANRHHVLGTIRGDGSVRLSGTEVQIDAEQVQIGMMPASHKLDDVQRDARVELHSAPLDPALVSGDAKLAGRLVSAGPTEGQDGSAFVLDVATASLVRVDGDQLEFTIWHPDTGVTVTRRS